MCNAFFKECLPSENPHEFFNYKNTYYQQNRKKERKEHHGGLHESHQLVSSDNHPFPPLLREKENTHNGELLSQTS